MPKPNVSPLHALPDFIEVGVPLPPPGLGGKARSETGDKLVALAAAPVGASVFFPDMDAKKRRYLGNSVQFHLGKGCVATRVENGGVRVWKLAEKSA